MDKKRKELFKHIEKELIKRLKSASKSFKYKTISNSLYKKIDDFYVHAVYFTRHTDNTLKFTVWNYVKTYESDKLFWTILDMESNINEKDSLRANGAYTMPSFKIGEFSLEITEATNLEEVSRTLMKKIAIEHYTFIDSFNKNTKMFDDYLLKQHGYLREALIKMIANIELQDLKKAKEMAEKEIESGNRGGYSNGDKDIYQYISEYCG